MKPINTTSHGVLAPVKRNEDGMQNYLRSPTGARDAFLILGSNIYGSTVQNCGCHIRPLF